MTEYNRSKDPVHLLIWVLVGLAVVATVVMLLTDSNAGLKLALIAALWAAALGAFMVSRYRKDKLVAERELELAHRAHEAELKATAAELENSQTSLELVRAQTGQPSLESELLREIKEEISALRAQLEELAGREWGEQPAALQADARRVHELQAMAEAAETASLIDDTPVDSELIPEDETPKKEPVTRPSLVDTTEIGVVEDVADDENKTGTSDSAEHPPAHRAPSAEAVAGRVGGYEQPSNRESNPLAQLISERKSQPRHQQPDPAPQPEQEPQHEQRFEPWGEPIVDVPASQPEPDPQPARPRRRRSDENAGGISVAELMERVRKAEQE
ncbi:DUF6779 domain-containing protein [Corynebacterium cystitidis]|uniref:DUF6779 domain-containing protein n=1 Tax=Corynebacterium cystitidis TaxID=35757 RepID=UPI00211E5729|nr:DUF6779 domain-containing protein [Corynebacterium cystitidis]